jgi:Zn-finger protein
MSVETRRTTRRHISEDDTFPMHSCPYFPCNY